MKKYRFIYEIVETYEMTVEAENEEDAYEIWSGSEIVIDQKLLHNEVNLIETDEMI